MYLILIGRRLTASITVTALDVRCRRPVAVWLPTPLHISVW
jgi:hypothetical protein